MKNSLRLCSFALCFSVASAFAGSTMSGKSGPTVETNSDAPSLSFEFDAQESYVGAGDVERGGYSVRDFEENDSLARLIFTPRIKFGILRLGFSYERFDFGIDGNDQDRNGVRGGRIFPIGINGPVFVPLAAELPNQLQAANFIVGLDTKFSDSVLFRIEAHPGWYGAGIDKVRGDTFRVPFIAGSTWIYSPTLQFTFGVGVNFEGKYPVLPGGGVRWQFAPKWVLNAVVPKPRLEYEACKNVTVYGGADLQAETYRVNERFGDFAGDRRLNNAYLTYSEVRAGVGFDWKIAHGITVSAEGGYVPYRTFDYARPHVRYREDGGAPYAGVALKAAF